METSSPEALHLRQATRLALVSVYDRGGNLVFERPLEEVRRYVDQPWTTTIRDRHGNVRRIYWKEPPPEIEYPHHPHRIVDFAGTRYVFLEKIWPDTPYRVFTLVEARFMPPDLIHAVTLSITRREPRAEEQCSSEPPSSC